jgi:hypothetical protein
MKSSALSCVIFSLICLAANIVTRAAESTDAIFDYDHSAPLNLQEVGREIRDGALIRDITFSPTDKPVKAFLVTPVSGNGPHAAILYVHWLGEPKTTNRTEFLEEATTLARHGVIALLVDTMWAEPNWYKNRIPEEDYGHAIRQVIELRRAMDLLLSQPGIDLQRVGTVAHDFGAMYGIVASSLDRRAKTYVFMAGIPHFTDSNRTDRSRKLRRTSRTRVIIFSIREHRSICQRRAGCGILCRRRSSQTHGNLRSRP